MNLNIIQKLQNRRIKKRKLTEIVKKSGPDFSFFLPRERRAIDDFIDGKAFPMILRLVEIMDSDFVDGSNFVKDKVKMKSKLGDLKNAANTYRTELETLIARLERVVNRAEQYPTLPKE